MKVKYGIVAILLLIAGMSVHSQTQGSLSFSCATTAPSSTWGDKHVLAIWIETSTGEFVKTNAKYGHEDDHLTSWTSNTSKNLVDAVTGSTLQSYQSRSVVWDGTDINGLVVADGEYKIFIEMGWGKDKSGDHSVLYFTFTKGETAVTLNPSGNEHYSDVVVEWTPTATLLNDIMNETMAVYPNPSSGLFQLNIKQSLGNANIFIENSLGRMIHSGNIPGDFIGIYKIDIQDNPGGIYFINIVSDKEKFTYKVILK